MHYFYYKKAFLQHKNFFEYAQYFFRFIYVLIMLLM